MTSSQSGPAAPPESVRPGLESLRFRFPDGELESWLVLEDVTDRSVRVWGRQPDGPPELRLSLDGRAVASATLTPDSSHDHVGAAVLEAPRPAPGAPFAVEAAGAVRRGQFAPADGEPAAFSFAFGSATSRSRSVPSTARSAGTRAPRSMARSASDWSLVVRGSPCSSVTRSTRTPSRT